MPPKGLERELRNIYNSDSMMCRKLVLATRAVTNAISYGEVEPRRELRDYLVDIGWTNFKESVPMQKDCTDEPPRMSEAEIIEECLGQIYDGIGRLEDLLEIKRQTSVYHIPYRRVLHEQIA